MKILLIPGDGVGSELAAELQKLISAVQSLFELKISTQTLDISELHFRDTNILIPKAFNKMAKEADAIPLPKEEATPPVIKTKCITEYPDT